MRIIYDKMRVIPVHIQMFNSFFTHMHANYEIHNAITQPNAVYIYYHLNFKQITYTISSIFNSYSEHGRNM